MKVKLTLTGSGGELAAVTIDVTSEGDPAISEAAADIACNGIHVGDTLTIVEVQS